MRRYFLTASLAFSAILTPYSLSAGAESLLVAQNAPKVLPSKKSVNTGPEQIAPKKGDSDPLNKFKKRKDSKKILTENQEVKEFVGIVQFLEGKANWATKDRKDPVKFKTLFHWNESLNVADDSYVKVITRSRCVAVIYGESQLQTPTQTADSSWNVLGGSSRWVCNEGQSDKVRINGQALTLSDGEFVYHKKLLYVIRGKAVSESGELVPGRTYRWDSDRWQVEYGEEDSYKSWNLAGDLPAPKESHKFAKPQRKIRSRWYIGPMIGASKFKHKMYDFEMQDTEIFGMRAAVNFEYGKHSVIASLNFHEVESLDRHDYHGMGPAPDGHPARNNMIGSFMADLGWRSNHQRDWAWTARLGIGRDTHEIRSFFPVQNISFDREVFFTSTRLSVGVEKIFFEEWLDWGGVLVSAEVYVHMAIGQDKTNIRGHEYLPDPTAPQIAGTEDTYDVSGLMIHIAPLLQF